MIDGHWTASNYDPQRTARLHARLAMPVAQGAETHATRSLNGSAAVLEKHIGRMDFIAPGIEARTHIFGQNLITGDSVDDPCWQGFMVT